MKKRKPAISVRKAYTRQLYLHNKTMYVLTALSMVLMAVFNLILSWLMQKITDKIAGTEPTPLLTIALWTLAAFV
ncbi:MAG TPA: hypothetical protein GX701_04775, partial [Clostridiales bacterium]|nr:hypothetical protein [Clostridiales bacterium]